MSPSARHLRGKNQDRNTVNLASMCSKSQIIFIVGKEIINPKYASL